MKKIVAIIGLTMLAAISALAWEPVWMSVNCATGALATFTAERVTGKVVYAGVANTTTAAGQTNTFAIATAPNIGASVGTARTIMASTNVTTSTGEATPNVYLYNETVLMTVTNIGTNVNTTVCKGVLILESYQNRE